MHLYLTTYGSYIQKHGEMFQVKIGEEKRKISPQKISSIIIANAATISTDAIQLAMDHNIDIVFIDQYGDPYGRIWFPKLGSTTLIRRKLLEIYVQDEGLEFVKHLTIGKINNQIAFLKTLLSKRVSRQDAFDNKLESMTRSLNKVSELEGKLSDNANTLMGYEGSCSKMYFSVLASLIPETYRFDGRSSRPAKDPFNACLNYGYGILYGKVEKALIISGLDPYIGLLHSDNYNKKSLVFDFIEPFRVFVEKPVFYLFSRHKVDEEHFTTVKNGVSLNDQGKKLLIPALTEYFEEVIKYRNSNIKRIDSILADSHAFANFLIGKRDTY